jgi:hypothetical protein
MEREGKPFLAEIPIVDESGISICYDDPPSAVNPIMDYENYYVVEDVKEPGSDPWIAARLDHNDVGHAWKAFSDRIGIKEPYYQALATLLEKWVPEKGRGEFLDDILVLLHASWRAGRYAENTECARLLKRRCEEKGAICLAHCTHPEDVRAVEKRIWEE